MDHDDMPRLEPAGRVKEKIREVTAEWTCEPRVPDEPPPLIPVRVRPVVVQWDESAYAGCKGRFHQRGVRWIGNAPNVVWNSVKRCYKGRWNGKADRVADTTSTTQEMSQK